MIKAYGNEFKTLIIKGRRLFPVGDRTKKENRYSNSVIKKKLQKLYDDNGLDRKAKATDIYELFGSNEIKQYKSYGDRGIEIL